jgi:hypothetical protein
MQPAKIRRQINMLIVDRFEGEYAIVETSKGMINIPIDDLPSDAREGYVLKLAVSKGDSEERKRKISGMMNRLFKD